jgi:hypothetical protein
LYSLAIAISNYRVQFLNVIHLSNFKFHELPFICQLISAYSVTLIYTLIIRNFINATPIIW